MKTTFAPKTNTGKWAIGLSIVFIVLITIKIMGSMPLPTFSIAAIGLIGFTVGVLAIIKNKERSILAIIPILVGLVIILWTAGELLFPH